MKLLTYSAQLAFFVFYAATSTASTTPLAVPLPLKIATGSFHTCLLLTDGVIKCWGYNYYNQLGTGDAAARGNQPATMGVNLSPVDLGLSTTDKVVDICAGQLFTCASTKDGGVKCWGNNEVGQLGRGSAFDREFKMGKALPFTDLGKDFKVKSLACGETHTCALSDQGLVKCWGQGYYGGLGLGDKISRGTRPEDMGDNLPALAGLTNIQAITAGNSYTCAASADGLRCWGKASEGQLGLENAEPKGNTPETIPGKLPFVKLSADSGEKILSITAGYDATCALIANTKTTGSTNAITTTQDVSPSFVKCWGDNLSGFLGAGNTTPYGLKSGTMGTALPRLDLGLDEIVSIQTHANATCALSKSGRVKCWGRNAGGQLGLGDSQSRGALPSDMGKNLPDVDLGLPARALSVGALSPHSCAILINSEIKCWGNNDTGQLGYENSVDLGATPDDMGSALPFVRFQ